LAGWVKKTTGRRQESPQDDELTYENKPEPWSDETEQTVNTGPNDLRPRVTCWSTADRRTCWRVLASTAADR